MDTNKMFEGRWRIKGNGDEETKRLCRDFFEAGILLREDVNNATYNDVCDITCPFDNFWELYDKKVGKPKCEKLWHKLSMQERTLCLAYIPLYKQAQPEKQYRKNPETFLRNKSWTDEIIFRNGNKQSTASRESELTAKRIKKFTDLLTD